MTRGTGGRERERDVLRHECTVQLRLFGQGPTCLRAADGSTSLLVLYVCNVHMCVCKRAHDQVICLSDTRMYIRMYGIEVRVGRASTRFGAKNTINLRVIRCLQLLTIYGDKYQVG